MNKSSSLLKNRFSLPLQNHLPKKIAAKNVEGIKFVKDFLHKTLDINTVLFLSGGRTPKELYTSLAQEQFHCGAVGLVDERYGEKMHATSNEKMIADSGLLAFLSKQKISFYPILQEGLTLHKAADAYDRTLQILFKQYQKKIGILGVGLDGHTAGIMKNEKDFINPVFLPRNKERLVIGYHDPYTQFQKRITMTFTALCKLDLLLVLVFGADKKDALTKMFREGSEEEVPARFFKRPEIVGKTLLITDQEV